MDGGSSIPRRNTESQRNLFRRMSAQAMGIEATALCLRSHWVPKSSRSSCSNCKRAFRLFSGKHHCRLCGEVVCGTCSMQRIFVQKKSVRSCDDCINTNVFSASELMRRNSMKALGRMASTEIHSRRSLPDNRLARSFSTPSHGFIHAASSEPVAAEKAQISSSGYSLTRPLRSWWKQIPYVVIVFLITIAGIANLVATNGA